MSRVALITGARRGIGFGIALVLARKGYKLAINDIVEKSQVQNALTDLKSKGVEVSYHQADIADTDQRKRLVEEVQNVFNEIHVLVNNAGVAPEVRTDILQATEESFERVMSINLQGPYFLTQSVANLMIRQRTQNHEAPMCIVNIASSNSKAASPDRGEYCVSKAGVGMSTKLWATCLGQYDISVYEIRPGIIRTEMTRPVKDKYDRLIDEGLLIQKRWGEPEDIGKAVAMLAHGDLGYSTGQVLYVDGGQLIERL